MESQNNEVMCVCGHPKRLHMYKDGCIKINCNCPGFRPQFLKTGLKGM